MAEVEHHADKASSVFKTIADAAAAYLGAQQAAHEDGRFVERATAAAAKAEKGSATGWLRCWASVALGKKNKGAEEVRAHAQEQRTIADAGAASADSAGQWLRDKAASFAAAVSCTATDPAAVARGEAATRAAMVLSDLLERAVDTNRELAKAYDRARIAGQQCEREHSSLVLPLDYQ